MTTRPRGRPPASSHQAIEETAIELFLAHGYEQTTISMIIAACQVSRTTFFRYYPSKAAIIWTPFTEHTERLRLLLAASPADLPIMTAVRSAVIEALESSIDEHGIWIKRFRILDSSPLLRSEESEQWISWANAIAASVARHQGLDPRSLMPQAIGGAMQAAFLAVLRSWQDLPRPDRDLLPRLDQDLKPLCDILETWLTTSSR